MEKVQVKGNPSLFRDKSSNAIVNIDMNAYQNYMESKRIKEEETKRIANIEDDLNSLKGDIDEIKNLLRSLVNGS